MTPVYGTTIAFYLLWIRLTRQTLSWHLVKSDLMTEEPMEQVAERWEQAADAFAPTEPLHSKARCADRSVCEVHRGRR